MVTHGIDCEAEPMKLEAQQLKPRSTLGAGTDYRFRPRPCKNVLSDGGAEVETKRRTPRAQARIASINGLVPITAITRFIL